jgi:hypothetical protein
MKRYLFTLIAALVIGLSMMGSVSAADHSAPGTPGNANCHGQTAAYLAQLVKNNDITGVQPGIGNLAAALGASVQDVQAIIDAYCNQAP